MKLIEILPNIYGVKVPIDLISFDEELHKPIGCDTFRIGYKTISGGCFSMETESKDNFRVLGFLTKDEISFDASEVVDSTEIDIEQYDGIFVATPRFWDYELESFSLSSSDDSFRSALPEDVYFENPIELPIYKSNEEQLNKDWEVYLKHQENITEKLLILQKL